MDHGKIIEEGTHHELIKNASVYEHAFKLQAEGYRS
jgi:ABC-type multidrug transport system fused ATPase/permease subunit